MKSCFVLILVLAGAASGAIEKRIVGSKSCGKERQYHVQIEALQKGKSCAGALLNTRWVITASHCAGQFVKLKFALNVDVSYKDDEEHTNDIVLIKLNEDVAPDLPTIPLPSTECKRPELRHCMN